MRSGGSLAGNSAATVRIGEDNTTITGSATTGDFCGKNNTYTVYFATLADGEDAVSSLAPGDPTSNSYGRSPMTDSWSSSPTDARRSHGP